ncbi:NPCBM/NEW2 domain-containing protein [Paenibacillus glufosinatiresistens]|uniref:NPCBM/NEW2 domain-containing protein n=1 Tax=Paenibacillus glufosinatiresistens TaxID=3070657 RepID=UPI00286EA989|nr:NPCBM/NEW2 domain-containing protein [Paenibacillus sp. YX.27]
MKDKLKGLCIGVVAGALLTGGSAYAATNVKLSVVMENVKFMFDGVHKQTAQSIVYNGQLYAPVKNVAQGMGESFSYDGKTKTAWIGAKQGAFKYLDEISYARMDGDNSKGEIYFKNWTNPSGLKFTIADQKFLHGVGSILDAPYNGKDFRNSIDYNLNGKYKRLNALVGVDDYTKNSDNQGTIAIYGDGVELYRSESLKGGDLAKEINVELTGVLKLQIVFETAKDEAEQLDLVLADAKLF